MTRARCGKSGLCNTALLHTKNHIVDVCPLTKFGGGLNLLHEADDDGIYSDCSTREIKNNYTEMYLLLLRYLLPPPKDRGSNVFIAVWSSVYLVNKITRNCDQTF